MQRRPSLITGQTSPPNPMTSRCTLPLAVPQLEGSYSLIVLHLFSEVQLQFCMGRGSSGSNFPLLWGEDGSSRRLHNLLALQI